MSKHRFAGFDIVFDRIDLEAGPLSSWLYAGLVEADLAAILVETRHGHAALSARITRPTATMLKASCR